MGNWIFLKDFDATEHYDQAINLDFVSHFIMRKEDAEIAIFFGGGMEEPHILSFKSKEKCQKAYDKLRVKVD